MTEMKTPGMERNQEVFSTLLLVLLGALNGTFLYVVSSHIQSTNETDFALKLW